MLISLIIPTYNERKNAPLLIEEILIHGKKNNLNLEVIIVDDNSPDRTGHHIATLYKGSKQVKSHIRTNEKGLSTAILHGINHAKGDIIVGMDADFNHNPIHIVELVEALESADLVVGSRFIKGGGMDNKLRYYGTYFFNFLLKKVLKFPVTDNMSGYYAIKAVVLRSMPLSQIHKGYGEYHLRMVWEAQKRNLTIREIPVYYKERIHGKSKSPLGKLFFTYLHCALQLRLSSKLP